MTVGSLQGGPRVGCLGGGQLGRMMGYASHRLGLSFTCLDPQGSASPAGQVVPTVAGSFTDAAAIEALANQCDVLTVEIEHVNAQTLRALQTSHPKLAIHPSPDTIALIQDKFAQKEFAAALNLPLGAFRRVDSMAEAEAAGAAFGYPFMLKSRLWSYDGKGNAVVDSRATLESSIAALAGKDALSPGKLYAEKWVPFTKELAVMVVRQGSDVRCYPVVETTQHNNICHTVLAPAAIPSTVLAAASSLANKAVAALSGNGIFGVELFLTSDGSVLLNEIAPRPHNSGHYTIEACETDQFENHLRAVAGLPLGSPALKVGASWMLNLLGSSDPSETTSLMDLSHTVPGAAVHWYGKAAIRPGRKVGHLTIVAPSLVELRARALVVSPATAALTIPSTKQPVVGIIMGSDSDLPSMSAAAKILDDFEIPYELSIVSAHRTPERMYTYAQSARARGLQVLIAGAGGAAHLPGMVAALTPLPVVGVPIQTRALSGMDSLLSIVQMPKGIPVATVAIGNAANAGLLAVRILGGDANLSKMESFLARQEQEVQGKINKMEEQGWSAYLANMSV
ncbi:phosphoribosylaminoimidazole carboxylase, ATPase subunit [Aphanomyces invadans]|uniref:phosphoribosylaminoimidazole carboxylase n=1 Tax=Aphanomyces invadans TaxID=157072 RepID=A0A024TPY3_9STRA|nr:phosphoribosylaminoimidazole carboxylase, ATPase subunit [Aphanomyces invadans]ETV96064.1 phosphoribosylaminoimidazole carboxylase, ATPase subunit [Aphanomyces invadans]|eukprot:XP_008875375.1 phosphoribosylaminoimidazole carboxylase, ATPase subunit [Aphanomyces invadans]